MNNLRKASVFIKSIGEPYSSEIIDLLSEDETIKLMQDMVICPNDETLTDYPDILKNIIDASKNNIYSEKGGITRG